MKPFSILLPGLALLLTSVASVHAAEAANPAPEASVESDLKALVEKVNDRIRNGVESEADLAAELKEFDEIEARYSDAKSEGVAEVLLMKAMLYLQVLDEPAKASNVLEDVRKKYPDTKAGAAAAGMLEGIERQVAAKKIRESLKVGAPFPPFDVKDMNGKPFSLAAMKGKVVLVDFWATWCMPCVMELPNVLAAYEKYHDQGFEVAGISLDEDRAALEAFLKKREMTWPQYFDGRGWQSELAAQYGITSIPATFLLDRNGVIVATDLRGSELGAAVAKALEAK